MKKLQLILLLILAPACFTLAQTTENYILLKPDRVFDGEQIHNGWVVLVKNNRIEAAGEAGTGVACVGGELQRYLDRAVEVALDLADNLADVGLHGQHVLSPSPKSRPLPDLTK